MSLSGAGGPPQSTPRESGRPPPAAADTADQDDVLRAGPHSVLLLQIRRNLSQLPAANLTYWRSDAYNDSAAAAAAAAAADAAAAASGGYEDDAAPVSPWMPLVGVILGAIILSAIVGNGLVVTAVTCFRRLRSVTNYFVVSLAVADIAVAVLVMPYSLLYEVYGSWSFGWVFCYFWISCDVTCCTASILHLCVISLDRYLAITSPLTYKSRMSKKRAIVAICLVWTCSMAISFVPIYLGWFADTTQMELYVDAPSCGLYVNKVYAVVSASTSFYIPLIVMLFVYSRIYRIASKQAKEIERLERSVLPSQPAPHGSGGGGSAYGDKKVRLKRTSKKINKDFKALKTLGTLMGVFCVSWLPFFLMYIILPFCTSCQVPVPVVSAITWLGYVNSSINPCIYAYLNRDFRTAFRKLLFCSGERKWPVLCQRKQVDGQEFIVNECSGPNGSGQNVSCGMPLKDM